MTRSRPSARYPDRVTSKSVRHARAPADRTLAAVVPPRRPPLRRDRRDHRVGARSSRRPSGTPGSPSVPVENGPLRRGRGRADLRASSARPGRSPPDRARRWRRSPPARSASRASSAGDETASSSRRSPCRPALLFLLAAVLRMGWLSRLLSKPVITGFLFGAAIDVVIGELPKLTGTDADGHQQLARARAAGCGRSTTSTGRRSPSAVVALVVVLDLHVAAPQVPGALVLVVGGLLASRLFDLAGHGVATVGRCRAACPSRTLPPWRAGARTTPATIAHGRDRPVPHRVLADRRRRPAVRRSAPLPHPASTRRWWPRG